MQVACIDKAKPCGAATHVSMIALRLQESDATDTSTFWCGWSYFLPGGGDERSSSPLEKVSIVLNGDITVTADDGETVLGPLDSCRIGPDEVRAVENRSNRVATMLVVMPYPPATS